MKKWMIVGALLVALAGIVWAQNDPFYIVQSNQGTHITAGTQFPAIATTGMSPGDGSIHVQLISGATANPVLWLYSTSATAWLPVSPIGAAVGNVPSTLATNAVDVANSIWGGTNQLIFESTVVDGFEFTFQPAALTGDVLITLPDDNATWAGTGSLVFSTLVTNAPEAATAVWAGVDQLIMEGTTADGNELIITHDGDPAADITITAADGSTGTIVVSTVAGNAPGFATSVTFGINQLIYEGATGGDGFQMTLTTEDPVAADRDWLVADYDADAVLVGSLLVTNAPDTDNSAWFAANTLIFEGATGGNAFEIEVEAQDSTVAIDTYVLVDQALAAANYTVHASAEAELATRDFMYPPAIVQVASLFMTSDANDDMYCHRMYIPMPITLGNMAMWLEDGGGLAAGDILGVALYYDADAGVQITVGQGDGTAAGLENVALAAATIQPGTYRICACTDDAANMLLGAMAITDADWNALDAAGVVTYGVATNTCTNGVPPATTGAMAADDEEPFMFKLH